MLILECSLKGGSTFISVSLKLIMCIIFKGGICYSFENSWIGYEWFREYWNDSILWTTSTWSPKRNKYIVDLSIRTVYYYGPWGHNFQIRQSENCLLNWWFCQGGHKLSWGGQFSDTIINEAWSLWSISRGIHTTINIG